MNPHPFLTETEKPLVAIKGIRCGYLQLAPAVRASAIRATDAADAGLSESVRQQEITQYAHLPGDMLEAARDWAIRLEALGARRIYWITLSEKVRHLHIHLYPRWSDEELQGLPLFEGRESLPQPGWTAATEAALQDWCNQWDITVLLGE